MTFEEAKVFLARCKRIENRDHYFGDREVYWTLDDEEVAGGYFGGSDKSVWIHEDQGGGSFNGEQAKELVTFGQSVVIGRNDETGPDDYTGV